MDPLMTSVLHRLLPLSLILLTGCSSSGIFNGRSSRNDGVAKAFETQRDAAREDSQALRRADAPVSRPPTTASNVTANPRQKIQIAEILAEAARAERANDSAAARIAFERVVALDSAHSYANYQLAVIADNEGRFTDAERHYQTLLRKSPKNADLLASLGWSYLLQGRYEESERTLREALVIDPKHRTAMYNLGWLYGTLGDYDQSLAIFRSAGSEEDAQRAVAELFPRGRPAVSAQLASGLPRNPFVSEAGNSTGNRGRSDNQIGGGALSAPAPWQRNQGRVQTASTKRDRSATLDSSGFDAAFTQLGAADGTNTSLPGTDPAQAGGVITMGGTEQPLDPPPGHDFPVITPRSGNTSPAGDVSIGGLGGAHPGVPLVGELTASRSRNPRGNAQGIPDWPDRDGTRGSPGSIEALSGARFQSPQTFAARVGLSAGPSGLPFSLSAPQAAPSAGSLRDTGTAEIRSWGDQRTADRLPRW